MKIKRSEILAPIKRWIIIAVAAVFMILLSFLYMLYQTSQREYEDKLVISLFGEQKMYTQMISKDVSRIYGLLLAKDTGKKYRSEEELNQRIEAVKADLSSICESFEGNLVDLKNNNISYKGKAVEISQSILDSSSHLQQIDSLWSEFHQSIHLVLQAEHIDSGLMEEVVFINDNNMNLLERCDLLEGQILEKSIHDGKVRSYFLYGMIAVLLVATLFSLYQLQYFLVRPFSQLYKGIEEIGLHSYPVDRKYPTQKKILPIVTEISNMFHKINHLITLIENINNNVSFMETLNFISNTFSAYIPYNYIGIGLISEDKQRLIPTYGVSDGSIIGLPEGIRGTSWMIRDTSLGKLIQSGEARIINDLEKYCEGSPIKLYNKVIMDAGIRSSITLPLIVSGEEVGVIFFSSTQKNVYTEEHMNFLKMLANSIAISLNQTSFISDVLYSSILALAKLAEARDEDTGEHLDRMSHYARVISEILYENNIYSDVITLEYIDDLVRFCPLHDIGKVGIQDNILLKPGKLTPDEFEEMKKHVFFGSDVLRAAEKNLLKRGRSLFGIGIEIAEGHHEKWDGSGYPYGRKGDEIPVSARIVALADVLDALTSKRPYKEAFSLESSLEMIAEGRGKHFDPRMVDVIFNNLDRIEEAYIKFHPNRENTYQYRPEEKLIG
ncbi:MAG: metal dependent phosphohydrolase [Herbinix sp.]|jgi:HD-GYP domain-containing protein (c-di-GMP phosphodiesterase class II)|nr:metal dependent phosphohydrolase [Herbinix sp.]